MRRTVGLLLVCAGFVWSPAVAGSVESTPVAPGQLLGPPPAAPTERATESLPAGAAQGWWATVQEDLSRREYDVTRGADVSLPDGEPEWQATNRAQNFRTRFAPEGIRVTPRNNDVAAWTWGLTLSGFGYEGAVDPVVAADVQAAGNRAEYRRGAITEWYMNDARGLEQGFTVTEPPAGEGSEHLVLEMAVEGTLMPRLEGDQIAFRQGSDGEPTVAFGALWAVDAAGRQLPSRFTLDGTTLCIVVDAERAVYPLTIDPLATSPAWTAESDQSSTGFGASVSGAGDVNGDGYDDVVVGAFLYDNGSTDEGRAYLYLGSESGLGVSPAWTAESNRTQGYFGASVAGAGDVNGDGYDDVVVGADGYTNGQSLEGRAYLYLGSATGLGASPAWTAESDQALARFGCAVAGAGDVNGDGYADVVVGARMYDNGQTDEGRAYLYLGSATGLDASPAWTAESDSTSAWFGKAVAGAGDVNGDGYDDVIVGAPSWSSNVSTKVGRVYLYLGSESGLGISPAWGPQFGGSNHYIGELVAGVGDVNGDGYDDVAFSEHGAGRVLVYFGSASNFPASVGWVAADQASSQFGIGIAGAGDVNGDGYSDLVVGAYMYDNGQTDEGRAYLYLGSATGLDASPAWTAESDQASARFGSAVAGAGDVNGDGYADVIVGAAGATRAYLFLGGSPYLTGMVTDLTTGSPIANAEVGALGSSTHTGSNGRYSLPLAVGAYTVTVSKTGYQTVAIPNVSVGPRERATLDVELTPPGLLNVVTTSLAPVEVGVWYSDRVRISGGVWPYSYGLAYGALPPGLTFDPASGTIAGTPSTAGPYTFAVAVTDGEGMYAEAEFNTAVTQPLQIITASPLLQAVRGEDYLFSVEASGGTLPYQFSRSSGSLPPGLAFGADGRLAGRLLPESFEVAPLPSLWTFGGNVVPYLTGGRLRFGAIGYDQYSQVSLPLFGVGAGDVVRFDYEVSSAAGDYLQFYVDGVFVARWYGNTSGVHEQAVSPGDHTLMWQYIKNRFTTSGQDTAWLDNVYVGSAVIDPAVPRPYEFTARVTDDAGRADEKLLAVEVLEPLTITTARIDDGIVGQPYEFVFAGRGGYGAHTWAVYTGQLPSGLSLDPSTGVLSGTPAEPYFGGLVVAVTDESRRVEYKDFRIQTADPLAFTTTAMPNGLISEPYSESAQTSGGIEPYSFSVSLGLLPAGLGLNSGTGFVSGTPTETKLVNFEVTVTDASWPTPQTARRQLSIRVTNVLTILTSQVFQKAKLGVAINPLVLSAAGGPSPYIWAQVGGFLPEGITLNPANGTLSGTPLADGDYVFTLQVTDSAADTPGMATKEFFWRVSDTLRVATFVIPDAAKGKPYNVALQAKGGLAPYSWRQVTGTLPAGISFNTATGTLSGTPASAQTTTSFTVEVIDADSPAQTAQQTYTVQVLDELFIATAALPNGREDEAYSATVRAALGSPPYSWRLESGTLPPGLTLTDSPTVATLDGVPTAMGSYTFSLEVSDSGTPVQTVVKEYTVAIYDAVVIENTGLASAVRGVPYSADIVVSGGELPYRFQLIAGSLPTGLVLNPATGRIQGTADEVVGHASTFTVQVTDAGTPQGSAEKGFVVQVIDPLTILTESVPGGMYGLAYYTTLEGQGGVSPHQWGLASGALPVGITLDPDTGALSGTPTSCGAFEVGVQLSDAAQLPNTFVKTFALDIQCEQGDLVVNLAPPTAVTDGASWSIDGGQTWHASGATVTLDVGAYTVAFAAVADWAEPAAQAVTVLANTSVTATGTYADIPPVAELAGVPSALTNSTEATVAVSGTAVVNYRYSLDGAAYGDPAARAVPIALTDLSDGDHTLAVIGQNSAGTWQAAATSATWTVDTLPPVVTLSGVPVAVSNLTQLSLVVGGDGVVEYRYSFDGAEFTLERPVAEPLALTGLADGEHSVAVIGRDAAGNWQQELAATRATWTVDTIAPVAAVVGGPDPLTNATTAQLVIGGDGVVAYRYRLDGAAFGAPEALVVTPIALTGLADGAHTVAVIGRDAAGNWQEEAASAVFTWTVDTIAPVAGLAGVPASPTNQTGATLTVRGDDVTAYQFSLDGGAYATETAVSELLSLAALAEGEHTVSVIGRDAAGNWQETPTTATWTVVVADWNWSGVVSTPLWADYYGVLTVDGQPAAVGDEVAVFDPAGNLCGHTVIGTEGTYGLLHVYGDDPTTPDVDEGAEAGDTLTFKVWSVTAQKEYPAYPSVVSGTAEWFAGEQNEVDLNAIDRVTIPLRAGWNLVSVPVAACWEKGDAPSVALPTGTAHQAVTSIADIFTSITGKYTVVRSFDEFGAHTYDPNLPDFFNDLTYVAGGYGYWVKMLEDADLVLQAAPLAPMATLNLNAGWNLVGYWGTAAQHVGAAPTGHFRAETGFTPVDSIADVVPGLAGNLIVLRSFDAAGAHTYDPTLPDFFNDLTYLGPGYGYWVKVNSAASFGF